MSFKLNDLQLILLSSACSRDDGSLLPAPNSIAADEERVKSAITSLVRRKLTSKVEDRVIITDAGKVAIGANEAPSPEPSITENSNKAQDVAGSSQARAGTKTALLIKLLSREGGATIEDLTWATGWLPHTVRAALTGLRKKGRAVNRTREDGCTRYQVSA